jgi:peptidyl-prolyl cis-trans isomerase SurA
MPNRPIAIPILIALMLLGFTPRVFGEIVEQIVAQVNNDIITLTQYNMEVEAVDREVQARFQGEEQEQRRTEIMKRLLPSLIDELLLIQKAEEFGMAEDLDLEANAFMEDMMKRNNIPSLEVLKQEMARAGVQYSEYYANLRKQILVNRLKGAMVRRKVKIMSGDIEAYYNEHIADYTVPETVHLQEIVMYTEEKDPVAVRRRMEEVRAKLFQGNKFVEVAKVNSEGPTAEQGGDIGSFPVPSLSPLISQAISQLKPGEYSDIIELDFGYEIVRLVKRTAPKKRPLAEVRDEIEDKLFRDRINPILDEYLDELKKESYIYVHPDYRHLYDPEAPIKIEQTDFK